MSSVITSTAILFGCRTLYSLLATPIELHCILLLVLFILQAMSGSRPDDLNEEPDINASPAIDPPTPQGFEELFSFFKTYLETRLEHKGQELEGKQKIVLQAEKFSCAGP